MVNDPMVSFILTIIAAKPNRNASNGGGNSTELGALGPWEKSVYHFNAAAPRGVFHATERPSSDNRVTPACGRMPSTK